MPCHIIVQDFENASITRILLVNATRIYNIVFLSYLTVKKVGARLSFQAHWKVHE